MSNDRDRWRPESESPPAEGVYEVMTVSGKNMYLRFSVLSGWYDGPWMKYRITHWRPLGLPE